MHGNMEIIEYLIVGSVVVAGIIAVGIAYGMYRLIKKRKS